MGRNPWTWLVAPPRVKSSRSRVSLRPEYPPDTATDSASTPWNAKAVACASRASPGDSAVTVTRTDPVVRPWSELRLVSIGARLASSKALVRTWSASATLEVQEWSLRLRSRIHSWNVICGRIVPATVATAGPRTQRASDTESCPGEYPSPSNNEDPT